MLVVGGLTESRMFKKFISALKNDLKSFFRPQPILGTIIKPHCIESKILLMACLNLPCFLQLSKNVLIKLKIA